MQQDNELKKAVKILVVDDSEYSRKTIMSTLSKEGFNVVGEASNAQEASDVLKNQAANLLIIDVVMPDVSGIELAKYLKDHFDNIYIIMISSLVLEHVILEAISAGASDFLHKPFSEEDLLTSVYKIATGIKKDEGL